MIGSGRHRPDEQTLATVTDLSRPITKRDVRRVLGFFSYFRAYIPNAAQLTHVLSNLVAKNQPAKVIWTEIEDRAFQQLNKLYANARDAIYILFVMVSRLVYMLMLPSMQSALV